MIYTVTCNPALDKTVEISHFTLNEVNRITSVRTDPGGKGINVSKVIKNLGSNSIVLGILAGQTGEQIENALSQLGISGDFTYVQGQTRTNLKIIDPAWGTNTDINEPGVFVCRQVFDGMLEKLQRQLMAEDIVILAGSAPQGAPADLYATWISACKKAGAKVFLDADGALLQKGIAGAPYLVKPNLRELEKLVGKPLDTEEEIIQAGQSLLKRGISWVIISLGEKGALFLHEKTIYIGHGIYVPVCSTVGAGDAMIAALAVGIERSMEPVEMIRLALATSAAKVMCCGSQAPAWEEIASLLSQATVEIRK